MSLFHFKWSKVGNDKPEIQETMGHFQLIAGVTNLTENEDIWSHSLRENVLVSAYPLALWMASSWWRLLFEPLPLSGAKHLSDWRMSHEMAAANAGFIWPRVILASDGEFMQIWSPPASSWVEKQSIRYINHLQRPAYIKLSEFSYELESFIHSVLARLDATGVHHTDLFHLWQEVLEERHDADSAKYRKLEAELGFNPDECPENMVQQALQLAQQIGEHTFSEITPTYGKASSAGEFALNALQELIASPGMIGTPQIAYPGDVTTDKAMPPWKYAKELAAFVRSNMGIGDTPIDNDKLCELLGLRTQDVEYLDASRAQKIALVNPVGENKFKFHLRKKHPIAKRFELARLLGDYLSGNQRDETWLTSTDLKTSRQKFQRAFAAELLLPLTGLQAYLDSDFSESAIEDAAEHYCVSPQTVESVLVNNQLIESNQTSYLETASPY